MSYDMIDRFLRNNLGDDDYAEYSAALDSLCVLQRKPLTDEIPKGVLLAISNAGLTLLKTQHGYELRKLGPAVAHGIKE